MSRARLLAAALVLLAIGPALALGGGGEHAAAAAPRPNIVLITTDDQTLASLPVMKRVNDLLVDRGTSFDSNIISFPLCCPSRATWITGQYAHNHGVIDNEERNGGGYQALENPSNVLPVWMKMGGYDTALIGKWLHDYRTLQPAPGWDRFWALTSPTMTFYYDYEITDSRGGKVSYGETPAEYQTDVLTHQYAVPYILGRATDPDPFFLDLSYIAPHWGRGHADALDGRCTNGKPFAFATAKAKPAPRHVHKFSHRPLPEPRSFNEDTLSDKPGAIAGRQKLSSAAIDDLTERYRCELASLLAVDEGVKQVLDALTAIGELDNTYVIFTSDNGYMHGEHRIRAEKVQPYEEALKTPLVIRGPGVRPGATITDPVSNIDLAPTIVDLAGLGQLATQLGRPSDGGSLRAYLGGSTDADRDILIEAKRPPHQRPDGTVIVPSFVGVRTARYTYVEHYQAEAASLEEGFGLPIGVGALTDVELYDLSVDPEELRSLDTSVAYAGPRAALASATARLRSCGGGDCLAESFVPEPQPQPRP
jgi:N-acetylglucosamine-6-sulfatase